MKLVRTSVLGAALVLAVAGIAQAQNAPARRDILRDRRDIIGDKRDLRRDRHKGR